MNWNELISLKEAAIAYSKDESTLRYAITKGTLIENQDCKKFGKQWVLKKSSLKNVYGPPNTDML